MNGSLGKTDLRLAWSAWVVVSAWITFNLSQHGLWLDEAHAWCIVRDSGSFADFRWNMRNEGHPWLWHALLFPLAKAGLPVWSMQALHGAIASASCALILFRAPFHLLVRALIVGGYFLVFEYAALSRNYAPGILLLFLAADLERRGDLGWKHTLSLVLLAQTHLWAASLVAAWTLLRILDRSGTGRDVRAIGAILLSCAVAFACILPADKLAYGPELERLTDAEHVKAVGRMLTKAFVPIPEVQADQPWNSSILAREKDAVANSTGLLLWVGLLFALPLNRKGRIHFVPGSLAVLSLPLLAPFQAVRYVGPILLVAIACTWSMPSKEPRGWPILRKTFLIGLLVVQLVAGLRMSWLAVERPFSLARVSVRTIMAQKETGLPVVVDRYDAGAPVSAYLGRPVYQPERAALGSFCKWFPPPHDPTSEEVMNALKLHSSTGCYLLGKDTLDTDRLRGEGLKATVLGAFTGGMIAHDDHILQRVERLR